MKRVFLDGLVVTLQTPEEFATEQARIAALERQEVLTTAVQQSIAEHRETLEGLAQ